MEDMNVNRKAQLERELLEMDAAFLNAILNHDVGFFEREIPEDFLSVFPDGRVAGKPTLNKTFGANTSRFVCYPLYE